MSMPQVGLQVRAHAHRTLLPPQPYLTSAAAAPAPPPQFSKIAAVEDAPPGAMLDVVGVVEAAAEWSTITKKDGTETQVLLGGGTRGGSGAGGGSGRVGGAGRV